MGIMMVYGKHMVFEMHGINIVFILLRNYASAAVFSYSVHIFIGCLNFHEL